MSPGRLFLVITLSASAVASACSGGKVQTPTSDKNYDDEGAPGTVVDPGGPGSGGLHEAGAHDASADAAHEASAPDASPDTGAPEAAAEAGDAPSE